MKNFCLLLAGFLALSVGVRADVVTVGTYDLGSKATFLAQSSNDNCSSGIAYDCTSNSQFNPLVLNLGDLDLAPGTELQLILGGSACYTAGVDGCTNEPLGGVFTSTEDLLSSSNQDRLPTQIAASGPGGALPNITDPNFNSYYAANGMYTGTGINTQIPDDFYICGTVAMPDCTSTTGTFVYVPTGANYLYVGVLDSFYADNGGNLTVTVNEILSPEPATWILMLGGLGAVAALRRRKFAKL